LADWWLAILFAPFAGSFLGGLIFLIPKGRPITLARSACASCGQALSALDLVPIVSYLALRGRCRHCAAPLGRFPLAVELASLGVALWAASVRNDAAWLWMDCVLGWGLLALAWIDWHSFHLPDSLSLPLLLAGLAATLWLEPMEIADHALGAALGATFFFLIAAVYRRLRGREGLGAGDAKLLGVAGAWLGSAALPWVVLIAAVAGIALALGQSLRGAKLHRATRVPFGPCLALAIWLLRLYGEQILDRLG